MLIFLFELFVDLFENGFAYASSEEIAVSWHLLHFDCILVEVSQLLFRVFVSQLHFDLFLVVPHRQVIEAKINDSRPDEIVILEEARKGGLVQDFSCYRDDGSYQGKQK